MGGFIIRRITDAGFFTGFSGEPRAVDFSEIFP